MEDRSTYSPHTLPIAEMMCATARAPISWPSGQDPRPAPLSRAPAPDAALGQFDYLIVTWTTEEAKCLADTLTPGFPSKGSWYDYTHNFESEFVPIIRRGAGGTRQPQVGKLLSHDDCRQTGALFQVRAAHESGWAQAADREALGPTDRGSQAEARDHHRHGRRNWPGDRTGGRGGCAIGSIRLHDQIQERAVPQQRVSVFES